MPRNKRTIREFYMRDIREAHGLQPEDTSKDEMILGLTTHELLNKYLLWNGIQGYTQTILDLILWAEPNLPPDQFE